MVTAFSSSWVTLGFHEAETWTILGDNRQEKCMVRPWHYCAAEIERRMHAILRGMIQLTRMLNSTGPMSVLIDVDLRSGQSQITISKFRILNREHWILLACNDSVTPCSVSSVFKARFTGSRAAAHGKTLQVYQCPLGYQ